MDTGSKWPVILTTIPLEIEQNVQTKLAEMCKILGTISLFNRNNSGDLWPKHGVTGNSKIIAFIGYSLHVGTHVFLHAIST